MIGSYYVTEHADQSAMIFPPVELLVWERLRDQRLDGLTFRRQMTVGSHVVDYYCKESRLAIELDGDLDGIESIGDSERRADLHRIGIDLLRFTCRDAFQDMEGVCAAIIRRCALRTTK